MPRPLRNRFVHLDLSRISTTGAGGAVKAQVRPEIIAFLRFKPERSAYSGRDDQTLTRGPLRVLGDGLTVLCVCAVVRRRSFSRGKRV